MGSCPDTDIDPYILHCPTFEQSSFFLGMTLLYALDPEFLCIR